MIYLPKGFDRLGLNNHREAQLFLSYKENIVLITGNPSLKPLYAGSFEIEFDNKRIDLICIDNDNTIFLFEIKTNQRDVKKAIKQILEYRDAFRKDEQARKKIGIHEFNDKDIRLGIIAPEFSDKDKSNCEEKRIGIYKLNFAELINN